MGRCKTARDTGTRQRRAKEAIEYLAEVFDSSASSDTSLAKNSSRDLSRVMKRHSVKRPQNLREKSCRGCGIPLVFGRNARVRIDAGMLLTTCIECGKVSRKRLIREGE